MPDPTLAALLSVAELSAGYGGPKVLDGITFNLHPGRITALLGANGAGKTTLIRALCGMIPSTGRIDLDAVSIAGRRTEHIARAGVAHVPEGRGTFDELSVDENLRVGAFARASRQGLSDALERIYTWLPRLAQRRQQKAGSLSGGEQQMLAIGRSLVAEPKVLLLDEPSFGLAPRIAVEVMDILRRLQQETRMGVLLVEQNATVALKTADDAFVIANGRIVASGSAAELRSNPIIGAAYLGAA